MSLRRRAAVRISNGVVRRASPGAKEWAEATAREVEFIESDWTALGWALGSVRILWQRREAAILSPADVPGAARELAREIHLRTMAGCLGCVFLLYYSSRFAWRMHLPAQRIGACMVVAGVLYMILQLLERRGVLPLQSGTAASAGAYRLELERQRSYHSGVWMWSRILMVAGYLMAYAPLARGVAATVVGLVLCLAMVPLNLERARQYQRRIDELDAVEKEA